MPGPLFTVTVARTAKQGFIASVLLVFGHSLLELLLVVALVLGLGSFMRDKMISAVIASVGGIFLICMGVGMIRDGIKSKLEADTNVQTDSTSNHLSPSKLMLTGALISISNPYWLIWWATIGLAALTLIGKSSTNIPVAIGAFYIGHILGDIVWYLAVGAAVITGRKLLSNRIYNMIITVCGIFLVFLGASFIFLVVTGNLSQINMSTDSIKNIILKS